MAREKVSLDRMELEIEHNIRMICTDFGITAARYFDLANLNSPHQRRPLSYGTFLRAMAGGPLHPDHEDMLSLSTMTVRQELRRLGINPLKDELTSALSTALTAWEDNPEIIPRRDLTALRGILRRALARKRA